MIFLLSPLQGSRRAAESEEDKPDVEVFKEQFGSRFIVKCQEFTTRLQANLGEDGQDRKLGNVGASYHRNPGALV